MLKYIKHIGAITTGIISVVFTIIPETLFEKIKLLPKYNTEYNIILNRILVLIFTGFLVAVFYSLYMNFRQHILIKEKNYRIKISYGDIFKIKNSKKVIPFDECYTTEVGEAPHQIKPSSLCGQYIKNIGEKNIREAIDNSTLKPSKTKSKYNNQTRYDSGTIIPNGEYLLLAFAKLNSSGLGCMNYKEYLDCLEFMWQEIDKHYASQNVCLPVLGSGITRFGDIDLTQQELLNIIIKSYKLSRNKIKLPSELHIVCRKCDGFSLNDIEI